MMQVIWKYYAILFLFKALEHLRILVSLRTPEPNFPHENQGTDT